jgi:allantoin racemase
MTMGFLGIAAEVTRELGVPVVNPVLASLRFAEALVGSGLTHSRRAYMPPPKLVADPSRSVSDLFSAAASTGTSS